MQKGIPLLAAKAVGCALFLCSLLLYAGCGNKSPSLDTRAVQNESSVNEHTNNIAPIVLSTTLQTTDGGQSAPPAERRPITTLKELAGFQQPDGTILITSGFSFDTNFSIPDGYQISIGDSGDIDKIQFKQFLASEQMSPDGKYVSRLANTAIGISWYFEKAQTSFHTGNYVYTALRDGSTVTFTTNGVLLAGFKIAPISVFQKHKD